MRWRISQFSLRVFLLLSLLLGMLAGIAGPAVVQIVGQWSPSQTRGVSEPFVTVPVLNDGESSAYFESGETPLN